MARARKWRQRAAPFAVSAGLATGSHTPNEATPLVADVQFAPGTPGHPFVDFPERLKEIYPDARHLGSGGAADVWSVEQGAKVLKVFYRTAGGTTGYATWKSAEHDRRLHQNLVDGFRECEALQDIHKAPRHVPKDIQDGANHIVRCFRSNLVKENSSDSSWYTRPLFLELQYAGDENLKTFIEKAAASGLWTLQLAMHLYRQFLKALVYLSHHPGRWVHHDLKMENIVVKTEGGVVTVSIVDFGASLRGNGNGCLKHRTVSSSSIAPPEWNLRCRREGIERGYTAFYPTCPLEGSKYDPCPQAFDMFGAAMTFIRMLRSGEPLPSKFWSFREDGWNYRKLNSRAIIWRKTFVLVPLTPARAQKVLRAYSNESSLEKARQDARQALDPYSEVIGLAAQGLRAHAMHRPKAESILEKLRAVEAGHEYQDEEEQPEDRCPCFDHPFAKFFQKNQVNLLSPT